MMKYLFCEPNGNVEKGYSSYWLIINTDKLCNQLSFLVKCMSNNFITPGNSEYQLLLNNRDIYTSISSNRFIFTISEIDINIIKFNYNGIYSIELKSLNLDDHDIRRIELLRSEILSDIKDIQLSCLGIT